MAGRNDRKSNDNFKQIEDSGNVDYGLETLVPSRTDAEIHGCDKPSSFASVHNATTVAKPKIADKQIKKKFFRNLWPKNKYLIDYTVDIRKFNTIKTVLCFKTNNLKSIKSHIHSCNIYGSYIGLPSMFLHISKRQIYI